MRDLERRLQRELEQSSTDAKRARKDRDQVRGFTSADVIRCDVITCVCHVLQAEAEVRRLKDAITQAQEEERENAERAIQTLVSDELLM